MNAYRLKRKYNPSKSTTLLYRAAFWLVVALLSLEAVALVLASFESGELHTAPATPPVLIGFGLAFAVVAVLMAASLYLWIGMLHFLFTCDGRSSFLKGFWFLLVLLTLQFGAALYYLTVYRGFLATIRAEES